MSTRSAIIEKLTDGTYRGIYCHHDGYIEGVGATLLEHYQEPAKVSKLIDLGSISSLGERVNPKSRTHSFDDPEPETTVAYGRDRGEANTKCNVGATVDEVEKQIGHNGFVYVFADGKWTCNGKKFRVKK